MPWTVRAGLVDAGETPGEAAAREMKEETGLDFTEYTGGQARYRRAFFMGQGFTDETSAAVFGTVSGQISAARAILGNFWSCDQLQNSRGM